MFVERPTIFNTALHELRPLGYDRYRIGFLGQQSPEIRVMPTKFLEAAIAMLPHTLSKLPDLFDELLSGHALKILIHHGQMPFRLSWNTRRITCSLLFLISGLIKCTYGKN